MNSLSSGELILTVGFVTFSASIIYATWPRRKAYDKDLEHALNSFRAQNEAIMAMKKKIDEHSESSLAKQDAAYFSFKKDIDQLKDLSKRIEWLEIKVNSKAEVQKFALPPEMKLIVENRYFVKKKQSERTNETITKPTPDYLGR